MRVICLLPLLLFPSNPLSADERRPFSLAEDQSQQTGVDEPALVPAALLLRRTQWLMFTAEWCAPCRSARADFESWLQRAGWVVDESRHAHVRLVDADRHSEFVQQQGLRVYPTFVLMQDGQEIRRHEGYPGRTELVRQFQDAVQNAPPAVGAISVGTLTRQKDNISHVIAFVKPLLGTDGTLTVRLERPGTKTAVLPLGDRMSIRSDNPLVMNYSMNGDVLTCRFSQPYPRGRFTFGLPVEQSVAAVSMSVSEVILELPHAPDVRLQVEP